jgi:hypothetical protein
LFKKLITSGLLLVSPLAVSEGLLLDGIDIARESAHMRPGRGVSMETVQAQYGMPSIEQAAVGEPPITRWDYPGFAVYFEGNLVIHSVAIP